MNTENNLDFDDMLGDELDFYGVDGDCFKLDAVIYEVVEHYEVNVCHDRHCFHGLPIARVVIEESDEDNITGYQLTDLHDGHLWLRFGTKNYFTSERSYEAMPIFDYTPKALTDHD